MTIIQKIPHADRLIAQCHLQTWSAALMIVFGFLLAGCVLFIMFSHNKIAKRIDQYFPFSLGLLVLVGSILLLFFGIGRAATSCENAVLQRRAMAIVAKSPMVNYTRGNVVAYSQNALIFPFSRKLDLYEIEQVNTDDADNEIVVIMLDAKRKTITYKAENKVGRASMKLSQYIEQHKQGNAKIRWLIRPHVVTVTYDDATGTHKVNCDVKTQKISK